MEGLNGKPRVKKYDHRRGKLPATNERNATGNLHELAELVQTYCKAETRMEILNKDVPIMNI